MSEHFHGHEVYAGYVLLGLALVRLLTSFGVDRVPAAAPANQFRFNIASDLWRQIKIMRHDRPLLLAVAGNAYFWFLGSLLFSTIVVYGPDVLHIGQTRTGYLNATLALGIGIGSMAAGYLSGNKIEYGLIPLGSIGMTCSGLILGATHHGLVGSAVLLGLLGFFAGFFAVPVNALIQHRPPEKDKGGIIADANLLSFVGIALSAGVYYVFTTYIHLDPRGAAVQELHAIAFERRKHSMKTLDRAFVSTARRHPFRFMMADGKTSRVTFAEALTKTLFIARRLRKHIGVRPMVGILLPPSVGGALTNYSTLQIARHKIPNGDHMLDAVVAKPAPDSERAALLMCHGIGETVDHWRHVQRLLAAHGVVSLVFDYPGYGRSSGIFTSSRSQRDAIAAFQWLSANAGGLDVSVLGFSLGSAVATSIVSEVPAKHLVLCSGFTSLREAAISCGVPSCLTFLLRPIWNTLNILPRCTMPVHLLHGQQDRLFPTQMAADLTTACGLLGQLVVVPGHSHDEAYRHAQVALWGNVVSYLTLQSAENSVDNMMRHSTQLAKG